MSPPFFLTKTGLQPFSLSRPGIETAPNPSTCNPSNHHLAVRSHRPKTIVWAMRFPPSFGIDGDLDQDIGEVPAETSQLAACRVLLCSHFLATPIMPNFPSGFSRVRSAGASVCRTYRAGHEPIHCPARTSKFRYVAIPAHSLILSTFVSKPFHVPNLF